MRTPSPFKSCRVRWSSWFIALERPVVFSYIISVVFFPVFVPFKATLLSALVCSEIPFRKTTLLRKQLISPIPFGLLKSCKKDVVLPSPGSQKIAMFPSTLIAKLAMLPPPLASQILDQMFSLTSVVMDLSPTLLEKYLIFFAL